MAVEGCRHRGAAGDRGHSRRTGVSEALGQSAEGLALRRAFPQGTGVYHMTIHMKVEGLLFDPRSGMYILLLQQVDGNETLPIWIGKPEADAIALALGKVITPRPLTH